MAGVTLVETVHEGGFWHLDAWVVLALASVILVLQVLGRAFDIKGSMVVIPVLALAVWWFVRSVTAGPGTSFVPFGASLVGFAAAFASVRPLAAARRAQAAAAVSGLGALVALVGFVGLIWRWYPIAMPSQYTWRLASTITYSDAAGLILAIGLLMALSVGEAQWLGRVAVCLCAGGLLATQSRGALVACACACAFIPVARYWAYLVPLLSGLGLGAVAVATSPWNHRVPLLGVIVVVAVAVSIIGTPARLVPRTRRNKIAVLGAVVILGLAATALVHTEIGLRALAPSDQDRAVEWSSALRQFESDPWLGVGPDRLLTFVASDGSYAHFAHNEYLQVLAGGGIVGAAFLALAGASAVGVIRRHDVVSSAATAAFVCWAVAGSFDFDWHLPVVGVLGGWILGLATGSAHEAVK